MPDPLAFYATHGPITDPGEHAVLFDGLPVDIARLCEVVQGLIVHPHWAPLYGPQIPKEREAEVQLRHVAKMLARIGELEDRPLTAARPLEKRLVGNCRDFTTLMTSMLRHQGVPARARCGFGAYFLPGKFEDHWVCEYWNASDQHWRLVDAQLDELQRKTISLTFDPLDVPRDQFLVAGQAWRTCRAGDADPDCFGLSVIKEHGIWWVRQNLVRDVAALNKTEMLPWDSWGLAVGMQIELPPDEVSALDHAAALSSRGDAFQQLRAIYDEDSRFRVPPIVRSFVVTAAPPRVMEVVWSSAP